MKSSEEEYFYTNKELWNKRTAIHLDSEFYNKKGFIDGATVLTPIELNELQNVSEKSLLHLQCHFGLDSLNWARLGARVTGVDISDTAIAEARKLNTQLGYSANFICSNIYDLADQGLEEMDIVFTSYGTIGWLPDLQKWAAIIAKHLKTGGIFYMADFHPVLWMFDDNFTKIEYAYHKTSVIITENKPTYVENSPEILQKEYGWNHSISELLNALLSNGLELKFFNEYNYSPYGCFNNSTEFEKGKWHINGLEGKIPMVYSLMAIKK